MSASIRRPPRSATCWRTRGTTRRQTSSTSSRRRADRHHRRLVQPAGRRHARRPGPQGRRVDPGRPSRFAPTRFDDTESSHVPPLAWRVTHRRRSNAQLSEADARRRCGSLPGSGLAACGGVRRRRKSVQPDGTGRPKPAARCSSCSTTPTRARTRSGSTTAWSWPTSAALIYRGLVASRSPRTRRRRATPVPDLATDTGTRRGRQGLDLHAQGRREVGGRHRRSRVRTSRTAPRGSSPTTSSPVARTTSLSYLDVRRTTNGLRYNGPYKGDARSLRQGVTCDGNTITYHFNKPWPDFPLAIAGCT